MLSSPHSKNKPIISIQIASNEMILLSTSGAKSDCRKNISDFLALRQTQNAHKYALEHCKDRGYRQLRWDVGFKKCQDFKRHFPVVYLLIQETATKHLLCINVRAMLYDEQQRMNTKGTLCHMSVLVLCVGEVCVWGGGTCTCTFTCVVDSYAKWHSLRQVSLRGWQHNLLSNWDRFGTNAKR